MAYDRTNPLKRIGPQRGDNGLWFYVDGDALGTIDGAGYFNDEADKLAVNDVIIAVGNSVIGLFRVNANASGVVDLDNAIPLPVAVVDSD